MTDTLKSRAVEAMARGICLSLREDPDADCRIVGHVMLDVALPENERRNWQARRKEATAALTALHRFHAENGLRMGVPVVATERMLSSAGYDSDVWSYRDDFVSREDRIHEWKNWVAAAPDPFAEPEA